MFCSVHARMMFPEQHSLWNLKEEKNEHLTYYMGKNYILRKTSMWYCAPITMAISMKKSLTCKPQLQIVIPFCTSHDPSHFLMTFSSILNKHKKCNPVNFWQFWGRHSLLTALTRSTWKTGSQANIASFWT